MGHEKGENMKLLRSLGGALSLAILLGLLLSSVPAGAQTLTALQLERSIALNNILTTITPQGIPPTLLAALAGGALDLREQINFNPQANALTSTVFVVATGSPFPTNLINLPATSLVAQTTLGIDRIYLTKPGYVLAVGSIVQSTTTPYGNYQGFPADFSFAYSSDKVPKISNVIETVAGTIVIYSAAGNGTFTIVSPPTTGGGGGGTGVVVSVNGSTSATPTFSTTSNQIILNASASTSTNPGTLTYVWQVVQGSAAISFPGGNTSIANVQLGAGKISYVIKLTVTDATGVSAVATITVQLI